MSTRSGAGALGVLQWLADNDLDKPVGAVTYTQLLNERGGIECDLTVTRVGADRFMLVTGSAFGLHDLSWVRSLPYGEAAAVEPAAALGPLQWRLPGLREGEHR